MRGPGEDRTDGESAPGMRRALLWEPARGGAVRCRLCAHRCLVRPERRGICGVRVNRGGELWTRVYGMATSVAVDPIEKKPLFHFYPGARALSIATVGCNFGCLHCQNWSISQWPRGAREGAPEARRAPERERQRSDQQHCSASEAEQVPGRFVPPEEVVAAALESGSQVIAYTYTEPTIYMEYALDCAKLARARGLENVFVTNGYLTPEAVELIAPYLGGANVDLKGTDDWILKREVKASSAPVLRTIEDLHRRGIWVEVTTLVIPGSNDDEPQLRQIAERIAGLSPEIPWHVSRFHPTHRMLDRPPTPAATLERAVAIGRAAGLRHVYTGNLRLPGGEDTRCASCAATLIERRGFSVGRVALEGGRCRGCGAVLAGRGLP